jgi:hypothetical protein
VAQTRRQQLLHPQELLSVISDWGGLKTQVAIPTLASASDSTEQPDLTSTEHTEHTEHTEQLDSPSTDMVQLDPTRRAMSSTNSPTPAATGIPGLKIPKPDKFDGSDTSRSTVTNWAYDVEEYLELSHVTAETQTKFASLFLDKEAKTWYSIGILTPMSVPFQPSMTSLRLLRSNS